MSKNSKNLKVSKVNNLLLLGVSSIAFSVGASATAQEANDSDDIVVTGIRSSLQRAQDTKRNADGIVDAISAEDIGKFPDTNLAESLQRITGVSINRVNGEGSQVTVRGFGAAFNLVTLNGRTLPGADNPIAGTDRSNSSANSRAFDFSNLASEGVTGIQVYKTGKATIPSGGIGATVNIETNRPLNNPGFRATIGAKGVVDTSVIQNSSITPEVSGLVSWTDDAERFGISLFGSFQQRDSGSSSVTTADIEIFSVEQFLDPNTGLVTGSTTVQNAPPAGSILGIPRDTRYHVSDLERERINGQVVLQYAPTESLTLTGDVLYARNDNNESRSDISNWFNRPFTQVVFDPDAIVGTPILLAETNSGTKDFALTQDQIGTRDELLSFGFNIDWQATQSLRFVVDGHISEAEVSPTLETSVGPAARAEVGIAAPFVESQIQTFSADGIPQQNITINSATPDGVAGFSITDVSSTVANVFDINQTNEINEINAFGEWDLDETSKFTFGVNYRDQENRTDNTFTRQILGFWNASQPGDVAEFAPGILEQFCLTCEFNDFETGIADGSETSQGFRGSAVDLFNQLSAAYIALEGTPEDPVADNNLPGPFEDVDSTISEQILAFYAQFDKSFEINGREGRVSAGLRYETTDATSTSLFLVPNQIVFQSDNDFSTEFSNTENPVAVDTSYDNFLPHFDLSYEVLDDFIVRASYSRTLARAGFGALNATVSGISISNPTALSVGGNATASSGNPSLQPLESDNFDISAEWYYGPSSFVSVGAFHKVVDNFIGNGTIEQPLFGLRDPASGVPGSRSGDALAFLQGDPAANVTAVNLFTLTSLIDSLGTAAGIAEFQANLLPTGDVSEAFFNDQNFVFANGDDALFNFDVDQPVNNETGSISGVEVALQHFFGETGFGIAGSYTYVDGDVEIDVTLPPSETQFALTGLSDTANITLIYEKYGFSARLAYNWRDEFLAQANRGGSNNPVFTEAFGQLDVNLSYNVTDNIVVSFEGINLTGENLRQNGRTSGALLFAQELSPRYLFGARYRF